MRQTITDQLTHTIKQTYDLTIPVVLTAPQDAIHGDYTTNIAFKIASLTGRPAPDIADELARSLGGVDGIVVTPVKGYLNIALTPQSMRDYMTEVAASGDVIVGLPKVPSLRIIVEFTDPNPFKLLHIGHVYSNTVGEAIARLYEAMGHEVWRVCYSGDVGMHVAKAVFGMRALLQSRSTTIDDVAQTSLSERMAFLGDAYAYGSKQFDTDPKSQEEIKQLNVQIYAKDPDIMPLYTKGREWSYTYFETVYARLGTRFRDYYYESVAGPKGKALVEEYLDRGVFVRENGAVIYKGEDEGLHTRVFINAQGLPTYEAKELSLAIEKYDRVTYDLSYIITANEITEYFKVLRAALHKIRPDLAEKTEHIGHGVVGLSGGRKMSSRTGDVITADWLLSEAEMYAQQKIDTARKTTQFDASTAKNLISDVAVAAVKYAFLKTAIGRDISFDFETSVSFEGNAGPYLQYTYVRTQSILQKADEEEWPVSYTPSEEETLILRDIYRFSSVVYEAASSHAPHLVCTFLFALAQRYNLYYQHVRILNAEDPSERAFRLFLTQMCGIILRQGLTLLGIAAPSRM